MLPVSFLFLVQEELEYSWPFAPAETVVKEVVVGTKDGFGCLFECQIFGHFSSIMDK